VLTTVHVQARPFPGLYGELESRYCSAAVGGPALDGPRPRVGRANRRPPLGPRVNGAGPSVMGLLFCWVMMLCSSKERTRQITVLAGAPGRPGRG
jgi:hypothetical protein